MMRKLSLSRLLLAVYIELWRFYSNTFDRIGKQAEWERYLENKEKKRKRRNSLPGCSVNRTPWKMVYTWSLSERKCKSLISTILFSICPNLNPKNETYSSSSKPQTDGLFSRKHAQIWRFPTELNTSKEGKRNVGILKAYMRTEQKPEAPLAFMSSRSLLNWLVRSMIKIIPDQTSFHHNQPHIPGINCWRHQPDSIMSTQNLCLVDKIKLHQPDKHYVYMDISNLIIYLTLNKTILWLRCLHESLLE